MQGYTTSGTSAGKPTVIRLPLAYRVYLVAFMCVYCSFLLAGLIDAAINAPLAVVIPLAMLVFGLGFCYRIFRVSATLDSTALLVRNFSQARRIPRTDIEGFRLGPVSGWWSSRQTIYVLLRDGTVLPLDVAGNRYAFTGGSALLASRMLSLQHWLGLIAGNG
jgi:hypothetical protein